MTSPSHPKDDLVAHLTSHAVRTDGPFTLRSGVVSDWYIDARQTTFDGVGATSLGKRSFPCSILALPPWAA